MWCALRAFSLWAAPEGIHGGVSSKLYLVAAVLKIIFNFFLCLWKVSTFYRTLLVYEDAVMDGCCSSLLGLPLITSYFRWKERPLFSPCLLTLTDRGFFYLVIVASLFFTSLRCFFSFSLALLPPSRLLYLPPPHYVRVSLTAPQHSLIQHCRWFLETFIVACFWRLQFSRVPSCLPSFP